MEQALKLLSSRTIRRAVYQAAVNGAVIESPELRDFVTGLVGPEWAALAWLGLNLVFMLAITLARKNTRVLL